MGEQPPNNQQGPLGETTERERREIENRMFPSALIVHEAIRQAGEEELERPPMALVWSGLAAGLSMGLSLIVQGLLEAHLPEAPWRQLVVSLGYSTGFLFVILGRQQLFTENTLTPILHLLSLRTWRVLGKVLQLWTLVLVANLVGAYILATIVAHTAVFEPGYHEAFAAIAARQASGTFGLILWRGVFAGWLIALMVWLLPGSQGAHFWVILLTTYLVGLAGLTHIIAGSVEVLYLVSMDKMSWGHFLGRYALPTLVGNIIGGVAFVAILNHAQVIAGRQTR